LSVASTHWRAPFSSGTCALRLNVNTSSATLAAEGPKHAPCYTGTRLQARRLGTVPSGPQTVDRTHRTHRTHDHPILVSEPTNTRPRRRKSGSSC
jgi:hypothetical protein